MSRNFLKRLTVFVGLFFVLFIHNITCTEAESNSAANRGISGIFLKKFELMTEDDWNSKPLDVAAVERNLSKYDAIWRAQEIGLYNRAAWAYLRRKRPDQIMLYYVSGVTSRPTDDLGYLDYTYIEKHHPEWFLLGDSKNPAKTDPNIPDNRIRWYGAKKGDVYYNRFFLDVGDGHFQKWAAEQLLACVSGKRQNLGYAYDGLAMDNVDIGLKHHSMISRRCPCWKYANDCKGWNKAHCDYLKVVRKVLNEHKFILVVNHALDRDPGLGDEALWNMLYDSADGLMTEQALIWGWGDDIPYFADDEWLATIKKHEEILNRGMIDWWCCYPPEKGERSHDSFLYTYCSWLLIKKTGMSFYFATRGKGWRSRSVSWYEEYELPIGEPTSERYLKNSCWLRDFRNAKVVVNPTRKVQKVPIDKDNYWLDWTSKQVVGELEIPPQTGRILLPISSLGGSLGEQ